MTSLEKLQAAFRARHSNRDETPDLPQPSVTDLPPAYADDTRRWQEFLKKQIPGVRPEARAIVLRHRKPCRSRNGQNENCECPKWGQPKGAGGKARFSLYARTWKLANQRIEEYCDARDKKKVREQERDQEWDQIHHYSRKSLVDGIAEYLEFSRSTKRQRRENESTDDVLGKVRSQRDDLLEFLKEYNAKRKGQETVRYFDQLTFELLQYEWRKYWPVSTPDSINNYRGRFIRLLHFAQERHWMKDTRRNDHQGRCQCIAHQLAQVKSLGDGSKKMPFNDQPELHGDDSEWQMKYLYKACAQLNTDARPNIGIRMENFIRISRYSGARISDVSLMEKCAVDTLGVWTYQPLKTKYTTGVWVSVQLPPSVVRELRQMPAAADTHRDYFFWTKQSSEQNAADPWFRDLADLWPLVDKEAGLEAFVDEQGRQHWGIHDAFSNQLVAVSSHTFRNTFAVCGRIAGMTFARLAECIGDTERIVKKHYARYTRGVANAIAQDVRQTWPEKDRLEYQKLVAAVRQYEATAAPLAGPESLVSASQRQP